MLSLCCKADHCPDDKAQNLSSHTMHLPIRSKVQTTKNATRTHRFRVRLIRVCSQHRKGCQNWCSHFLSFVGIPWPWRTCNLPRSWEMSLAKERQTGILELSAGLLRLLYPLNMCWATLSIEWMPTQKLTEERHACPPFRLWNLRP